MSAEKKKILSKKSQKDSHLMTTSNDEQQKSKEEDDKHIRLNVGSIPDSKKIEKSLNRAIHEAKSIDEVIIIDTLKPIFEDVRLFAILMKSGIEFISEKETLREVLMLSYRRRSLARKRKADEFAVNIKDTFKEIENSGITTDSGISHELNRKLSSDPSDPKLKPPRSDMWNPMTVKRIRDRINSLESIN